MAAGKIRIDGDRLLAQLERFARIGGTPQGGMHRPAFSREDLDARDMLRAWWE